jgi:hypothetical protein
MSVKQTTSVKTTTNLNTGSIKSFKTSYKTSSPTNIGKGGLTALGRAGMITITIISVSVGSAMFQYNVNDLISITPNYNQHNVFIPIEDPLNTINYQQYGEDVISNLMLFIEPLSFIGQSAFNFWDNVMRLFFNDAQVQEDSFIDTFGSERFLELADYYNYTSHDYGKSISVYSALTEEEKDYLIDVNTNLFTSAERYVFLTTTFYVFYFDHYYLFDGNKFFWTMPNVIDLIYLLE